MFHSLSKAIRTRLLQSNHLSKCLEHAHWISGLNARFIDPDGNLLAAYPRRPLPNMCLMLRNQLGPGRACSTCGLSRSTNSPDMFHQVECPARLASVTFDLKVDEQLVGQFNLWPYRSSEATPESCRLSWSRLAREGASISWNKWKSAWDSVASLQPKQVVALQHWLGLAVRDVIQLLDEIPHTPGTERPLPGLIHRVCTITRDEYHLPLRLTDIAATCGVTPEHLSRLFHESTGLRFRDYLREVRLNEACRLLLDPTKRISDIAEQVGHSSISRFNRAFKEYTGLTPREWRQRARHNTNALEIVQS
jgi:AraC-like DNA-binding protein